MPGLRVGDGWISLGFSGKWDDRGALGFRYHFDIPGQESHEGDDLYAPLIGGVTEEDVLRRAFAAFLSFLLDDAGRYRYFMMDAVPFGYDSDPYGFPLYVVEWAYQYSDELSILQYELEEVTP